MKKSTIVSIVLLVIVLFSNRDVRARQSCPDVFIGFLLNSDFGTQAVKSLLKEISESGFVETNRYKDLKGMIARGLNMPLGLEDLAYIIYSNPLLEDFSALAFELSVIQLQHERNYTYLGLKPIDEGYLVDVIKHVRGSRALIVKLAPVFNRAMADKIGPDTITENVVDAAFLLIEAYFTEGKIEEASKLLQWLKKFSHQLRNDKTEQTLAASYQAEIYFRQGDYKRAIELYFPILVYNMKDLPDIKNYAALISMRLAEAHFHLYWRESRPDHLIQALWFFDSVRVEMQREYKLLSEESADSETEVQDITARKNTALQYIALARKRIPVIASLLYEKYAIPLNLFRSGFMGELAMLKAQGKSYDIIVMATALKSLIRMRLVRFCELEPMLVVQLEELLLAAAIIFDERKQYPQAISLYRILIREVPSSPKRANYLNKIYQLQIKQKAYQLN